MKGFGHQQRGIDQHLLTTPKNIGRKDQFALIQLNKLRTGAAHIAEGICGHPEVFKKLQAVAVVVVGVFRHLQIHRRAIVGYRRRRHFIQSHLTGKQHGVGRAIKNGRQSVVKGKSTPAGISALGIRHLSDEEICIETQRIAKKRIVI